MKRTPLTRKTPLQSRTPLKRTEFKRKPPKDPIPASARKAVKERSEGMCELQVPGVCIGIASDVDHIKNRPHCSKDEKHSVDNLAHACRPCHTWKTDNPNEAEKLGIYRRNSG